MPSRVAINPLRFFTGLGILVLVLSLQIFLASVGWYLNLGLAALIAFGFIFDFTELLVLDLIAVFILNWKPAPSVAMLVFALIPLAIFFIRNIVQAEPWIGTAAAIFLGFFIFYFFANPSFYFLAGRFWQFIMDFIIGTAAGELILLGLG